MLADEQPAHSMRFDSPAEFFDIFMRSGPMHARLLAQGPQAMAAARKSFLAAVQGAKPFVITPNARLLVLQRQAALL